jgi:hypothetical protein
LRRRLPAPEAPSAVTHRLPAPEAPTAVTRRIPLVRPDRE